MTNDYLGQLRLTKQLEQKAREAAQSRKAAEQKIAEAEKALSSAKEIQAETADAERCLVEGTHAYSKKEYVTALSLAVKCLDKIAQVRQRKITSILDSAEETLKLAPGTEEARREPEALIARGRELLGAGKSDEAFATAKQAWDRADQYANRCIADTFGRAQALLLLGEGHGLDVSSSKASLATARRLLEDGDRRGSIGALHGCLDEIQATFGRERDRRSRSIDALLAKAKAAGIDLPSVDALLRTSAEAFDGGDMERSLESLSAAEKELPSALAKGAERRLTSLSEQLPALQPWEVDTTPILTVISKGLELARSGQGLEALQYLGQAEAGLRSARTDLFLGKVEGLRSRMIIAQRTGADISGVLSSLEESRQAMDGGDFPRAMKLVDGAGERLERALRGYRELGAELERTMALFAQARRLSVRCPEASELVARSRQEALGGKLDKAASTLKASQARMVRALQEHYVRAVLDNELAIALGHAMDADVSAPAKELDELIASLKEGDVSAISERMRKVTGELQGILRAGVEERIKSCRSRLERGKISGIRPRVEEAERLLAEGRLHEAWSSVEEVSAALEDEERKELDRQIALASSLLEIGRRLGCESLTLNQKMASVESMRSDPSEALRTVSDVVMYTRNIIRDELTRSLASLVRRIAEARKSGAVVSAAERLAEETSRAIGADDMVSGYALLQEAEGELQKTTALHTEVYDLIALLSKLVAETGGREGKAAPLLEETKRLFEAGRYDGARVTAKACYREMERIAAHIIAPRKLQEARGLLAVLHQLSVDRTSVERRIAASQSLIDQGNHADALSEAGSAHRDAAELLTLSIGQEIKETTDLLARAKAVHAEVAGAASILEKASSLLTERRYADSLRATRLARGELEQVMKASIAARLEIDRAREALGAIKGLGAGIEGPCTDLERAEAYMRGGRFTLATELARKALHTAGQSAREHLFAELEAREARARIEELRGTELDALAEDRRTIIERLDDHRFAEAMVRMDRYDEDLTALRKRRERCAEAVGALAKTIGQAALSAGETAEANDLMERAKKSMNEGRFAEALSLIMDCEDLVHRSADLRAVARNDLDKEIRELHGLIGKRWSTPEVDVLLAKAEHDLEAGDLTALYAHLRAARREAMASRERAARTGAAEVINLARLLPALDIGLATLPASVKEVLDQGIGSIGITALEEAVGTLNGVVQKALNEKAERVAARIAKERSKGRDVTVAENLLAAGTKSIADGLYSEAVDALGDAEAFAGIAGRDLSELQAKVRRCHELISAGTALRVDISRPLAVFRDGLRERSDLSAAIAKLSDAACLAEAALDGCLPDVHLVLSVLPEEQEGWRKVRLELDNSGAGTAVDLAASLGGPMEVKGLQVPPMMKRGERFTTVLEVRPDGRSAEGSISLIGHDLFRCVPIAITAPLALWTAPGG